jgi:hypothetical protein
MNFKEVLTEFQNDKTIRDEFVESIEENRQLRIELIDYFKANQDRDFVIHLLDKMVAFRRQENKGMTGDSIMLACYLLGLHKNVEDCLKIWNAKTTDFDTYCYVDIQLVPFAGLDKTIDYLKDSSSKEAEDALKYVLDCKKSGDFDELDSYYTKDSLPWYV